jgi:hypothetical protein
VCEEAVQQVGLVVTNMLAGSSAQLVERLVAAGCNVAIIGRNQVHTTMLQLCLHVLMLVYVCKSLAAAQQLCCMCLPAS